MHTIIKEITNTTANLKFHTRQTVIHRSATVLILTTFVDDRNKLLNIHNMLKTKLCSEPVVWELLAISGWLSTMYY